MFESYIHIHNHLIFNLTFLLSNYIQAEALNLYVLKNL